MASTARSLRLCLRACRQTAAPRTSMPAPTYVPRRAVSTTPIMRLAKKKGNTDDEALSAEPAEPTPEEIEKTIAYFKELANGKDLDTYFDEKERIMRQVEKELTPMEEEVSKLTKPLRPRRNSLWNSEEEDQDLITDEINEDEFDEDDIMSMAHAKLEEFREYREYARIAAWQMPLLSKLAKPFEVPTAQQLLRFRYTTYMGELHPAENKVVLEFCPADMPLTNPQKLKLKKLLGVRFNPFTGIAKMSCEQFDNQAQNKRFLGDVVDKLLEQARDPTDMFLDVPLDTRHAYRKTKVKFPKEWRMTEARRAELEDMRQKQLLLDQQKEEEGTLIDGRKQIATFLGPQRVPEMVTVGGARLDKLSPERLPLRSKRV